MSDLTIAKMTEYLKDAIWEKYEIDITKAKGSISSRNIGFVFPDEDYVLRVNLIAKEKRQILSEAFFVDYIKLFIDTICEPMPSLSGKLMEELVIGGKSYYAVKFKKAVGKMQHITQDERMTTICAGELLGKIHKISRMQTEDGFKFSRPHWEEVEQFQEEAMAELLGKESSLYEKASAIVRKAKAVTRNEHTYGLIHGDFAAQNMFRDYNNLWVFDFDDCSYNYFVYDIATYLFGQASGYARQNGIAVKDAYILLRDYLLIGYRLNMDISEEQVELLPLFMLLRAVGGLNISRSIMRTFSNEQLETAAAFLGSVVEHADESTLFDYFEKHHFEDFKK